MGVSGCESVLEKGCGSSKLYSSSLFSSYLRSSTEPDPDSQSCTVNPHTFTHILSIIGQASTSPLQIHASTFNTIPPPQDPTSVLFRYDPVSCFLPLSLSTPKPRLPSPCKKKKKKSKESLQILASGPRLRHRSRAQTHPRIDSRPSPELGAEPDRTPNHTPFPFSLPDPGEKGKVPTPIPQGEGFPLLSRQHPKSGGGAVITLSCL